MKAQEPNPGLIIEIWTKHYWNTIKFFHFQIIYDYFHAVTIEMKSHNRLCGLHCLKYLLAGPLQKKKFAELCFRVPKFETS